MKLHMMKEKLVMEKFTDITPEVGDVRARKTSKVLAPTDTMWDEYSIREYMEERHWSYLGGGAFSMVFEHPDQPGYVLKLTQVNDRGWIRFYMLAKKSQNPHFPEVGRMGVMEFKDPRFGSAKFYGAVVEKLGGDFNQPGEDKFKQFKIELIMATRAFWENPEQYEWPKWIVENYPDWPEAARLLVPLINSDYYEQDLHLGNILIRDKTPVFSDPLKNSWIPVGNLRKARLQQLGRVDEKFADISPEIGAERGTAKPHANPRYDPSKPTVRSKSDAFRVYMESRGWKRIGSGAYAAAFENVKFPNYIMKIMSLRDRGYMRFYSLARRSDNEHFPEVGRMGVMNVPSGTIEGEASVYGVMVEKLATNPPFSDHPFMDSDKLGWWAEQYISDGTELPEWVTQKWPHFREALDLMAPIVRRLSKRGSFSGALFNRGMRVGPAEVDGMQYQMDIHGANIMWRGDVPVITDPLVGLA